MQSHSIVMSSNKFLIIDGSSFLYRAFYALPEMKNARGFPTNAIYGVFTMIQKLVREESPGYVCVCYDLPAPTFRHQDFEEYKAHRKATPEDLIQQIPKVKEVLEVYGIKNLECSGFEADDIMAALSDFGVKEGLEVYLVTGDKDILQLVRPHVYVMRINPKGVKVYDDAMVREEYGVEPRMFPDFIGLAGDSSDNIPGVPGIGDKTAKTLLELYDNLENILDNVQNIKNLRAKTAIEQNIEQARFSKKLATLNPDVPLSFQLGEFNQKPGNIHLLHDLFMEYGFNRLIEQLELRPAPTASTLNNDNLMMVSSDSSISELREVLSAQNQTGWYYDANTDQLACYTGTRAFLLELSRYPLIADTMKHRCFGFDWKDLSKRIYRMGLEPPLGGFDIGIASYLIDPQLGNVDLSKLAFQYLKKNLSANPSDMSLELEMQTNYLGIAEQAKAVYEIGQLLELRLTESGLDKLFYEIEMPLCSLLGKMEQDGIKVNIPYLRQLSQDMEREMNRISLEIFELSGGEFNINSPKQLAQILFERLKLPVVKKTKTGYSTDIEVLEELSGKHPLPHKILQFRTLMKIKSTYVDAYLAMAQPETQTIHTHFQQTVASTGRIISAEPNLQNLPIFSEWGDKIRTGFITRSKDAVFLSADYSQIELRLLAHISQDENLMQAFRDNKDIHTETACKVFNLKPEEVTGEMRRSAKAINFGIVYGMSAYGLSKSLKIEVKEAQAYIDTYFQRFPKVREYMDRTMVEARDKGYVTTLMGRRCYLTDIGSSRTNQREASERQAINAPIQGSAADMLKIAMLSVSRAIKAQGLSAMLLLTIHDELVLESPESEIERLQPLVKNKMETAMQLDVPILVDIGVGKNLAEC